MTPRKRGRGRAAAASPTLPSGGTGRELWLSLRLAGAESRLALATERADAALAELARARDALMGALEPTLPAIIELGLELTAAIERIERIGRRR